MTLKVWFWSCYLIKRLSLLSQNYTGYNKQLSKSLAKKTMICSLEETSSAVIPRISYHLHAFSACDTDLTTIWCFLKGAFFKMWHSSQLLQHNIYERNYWKLSTEISWRCIFFLSLSATAKLKQSTSQLPRSNNNQAYFWKLFNFMILNINS